ncbi:MAG TPA: prolyl oligopeptidase family serine peptidase [Polyangiaceae bacterium]|nr:prolyl oligopeptidase family serine peptidase [Polyangiaceae bacterium]
MLKRVFRTVSPWGWSFVLVACGGGTPAPSQPSPASSVSIDSPLARPALAGAFPARPLLIPTRRENVSDTYFGRKVSDPYRWLESGDSEEVKHWTEEQNAVTRRVLDRVRDRERLHSSLSDLLSIGTVGTPAVRKVAADKNRYFHVRREGQQNQPLLYVREGVQGADDVLVDPNLMSAEGTTSLDWWSPSHDGRLLVYGISQNGDEDSTLFVRDVEKKKDLPDKIERTKYASIAWLPDGKSFYYTRYPKKGTVPDGEENYHRTVYLHRIGDEPDNDTYVFGKDRKMTDSPSVDLSPDGRWLLVTVHEGWAKNELYLKDLHDKKQVVFSPVVTGVEAIFDATLRNDVIYVRTNDGASRYKLYSFDPKKPDRAGWKQVIAEGQDVLNDVAPIGVDLVATYLSDASSKVRIFTKNGEAKGEVALPTIGSTAGAAGRWDGDEAFYDFSSFAVAPTIYRLDLKSAKSEKWDAVEAPIDAGAFDVERIRATSKDGTKVPIFLIHKKGLKKDGKTPTLLTAYGGFNINIVPNFSASMYLLLERGGILAVANLRGGGEFGETWHQAGMLGNKQNVFDDAIAAASELISAGYTDSAHLGLFGRSNGGLLVGALITQRPDLFRAAVCGVPLLDMLRYHRFRIAKLWVAEYGSSEDAKQFDWLYAYSPYHHVKAGTRYPAVLLTTAESDSRVDPLHARKMAAAMQAATISEHPILLRVETKAGHGAGKPINKVIDEMTDVFAFLFAELDMLRPQ